MTLPRRQFLSLLAASTGATLLRNAAFAAPTLPHGAPAPAVQPKRDSFIALAQDQTITLLRPSGEILRELPLKLGEDMKIQNLSASADGSLLCFGAGAGYMNSNNMTIFVVNADGSNLRAIKPQSEWDAYSPTMSPDGKQIVCKPYVKDGHLHIMDLDRKVRDLGDSTAQAGESHFSRDGQTLFFIADSRTYSMPVAGGPAERITRGLYASPFDVGPGDAIIAVVPSDNYISNLVTINPHDKPVNTSLDPKEPLIVHQHTNVPGLPTVSYSGVAWSPDGKEFAFTRSGTMVRPTDEGFKVIQVGEGGVFIASLAEPKPRHIFDKFSGTAAIVWR